MPAAAAVTRAYFVLFVRKILTEYFMKENLCGKRPPCMPLAAASIYISFVCILTAFVLRLQKAEAAGT